MVGPEEGAIDQNPSTPATCLFSRLLLPLLPSFLSAAVLSGNTHTRTHTQI